MKLGRLPLRTSAQSVNWLTTSTPPRMSRTERFILPASSSKIRRFATLRARSSASPSPSPCSTPSSTRRPRPMAPTTRSPTVTLASLTRCTSAFIAAPLLGPYSSAQRREKRAIAARVDLNVEQVWPCRGEGPGKGRAQLGGAFDSLCLEPEAARRGREAHRHGPAAPAREATRRLLQVDQGKRRIVERGDDDRAALLGCGRELTEAHREAAVADEGDDPALRLGERRRDRRRQGKAHGRETVRDQRRLGLARRPARDRRKHVRAGIDRGAAAGGRRLERGLDHVLRAERRRWRHAVARAHALPMPADGRIRPGATP